MKHPIIDAHIEDQEDQELAVLILKALWSNNTTMLQFLKACEVIGSDYVDAALTRIGTDY